MEYQQKEKLIIDINGTKYIRIPIKTHIITKEDNLSEIIDKYTKNIRQPNDIIFCSKKIVAITQGRSFHINDIQPSWFAQILAKFVKQSHYGIGLSTPQTMHIAIKDIGLLRILLAIIVETITKPLGLRGIFYKICGPRSYAIDTPSEYSLPPYNQHIKMAPANPNKVARQIKEDINLEFVIIDTNDLQIEILGKSNKNTNNNFLESLIWDNPFGQPTQQTPIVIARKIQ
jgi:F420-0:gamma-glutamyl ligase-like protein